jgi:hypothetical protein
MKKLKGGRAMKTIKITLTAILFCMFVVLPCFAKEQTIGVAIDKTIDKPNPWVEILDAFEQDSPIGIMNATNTIIAWQRCLSETGHCGSDEPIWTIMPDRVAFYRDVNASVKHQIIDAEDGDTWWAIATDPSGSTTESYHVKFYANLNGQQNCFERGFPVPNCGSNDIILNWWTPVQCKPCGQWTINLYENGINWNPTNHNFDLMPEIDPDMVNTLFNQGDYRNIPYDNRCIYTDGTDCDENGCKRHNCSSPLKPNEKTVSIARLGCAIVAAAMMLNYHGIFVTPPELNAWLSRPEIRGYDDDGDLLPNKIAQYARDMHNIDIRFEMNYERTGLPLSICYFGPQIIRTRGVSDPTKDHFVVATGYESCSNGSPAGHVLINDPNGGRKTTLAEHGDKIKGIWVYAGPDQTFQDSNGVIICFHSPVEAVLTDDQGRRLGYDPITGQTYKNEIFWAITETYSYDIHNDEEGELSPEELKKRMLIENPYGEYSLSVIGTGNGTYGLEIHSYDQDQNSDATNLISNVPITINETHQYKFQFFNNSSSSDQLEKHGGYDGGGQKPPTVNKFLTYVRPAAHNTDLPFGVSTYPIII